MEYLFNKLSVAEYPPRMSATLSLDAIDDLKLYLDLNPDTMLFVSLLQDKFNKCYEGEDLDILKEIPNVKRIYFGTSYVKNFSGLYYLKELKELINLYDEMGIDYSHFSEIEKLEINWSKKDKDLFTRFSLKSLRIHKYKSQSEDLIEFSNLNNLNNLWIIQSTVSSINGIEKIPLLKKMTLAYNSKLKICLNNLNFVISEIDELVIESCKNIGLDFVKIFPNIKRLEIRNQGKISSLRPILEGLPKLEKLFVGAGTIIEEADNKYYNDFDNIRQFFFQDTKNHYLKCKDLNKEWIG